MAGTSISSRMGSKVIGKYGTYLIKKKIGNGGNGVVFVADIIEGGKSLPQKSDYAIKFLDVASNEEKKLEKRKLRFRKEIETVLSFQDKVSGIIPIYSSISPRLKSRGHKYFINKSHMLSFVLQFKRGGTLQSTWR